MNLVIDTNVIKNATLFYLDHMSILLSIRSRDFCLTLDNENQLIGEYRQECGSSVFFQHWYTEIMHQQKIYLCDHKVPNAHKTQLAKMGFHEPIDNIVVGLAYHSDRHIVTEDSDFGIGNNQKSVQNKKVLDYLTDSMGLTVQCAKDALLTFG